MAPTRGPRGHQGPGMLAMAGPVAPQHVALVAITGTTIWVPYFWVKSLHLISSTHLQMRCSDLTRVIGYHDSSLVMARLRFRQNKNRYKIGLHKFHNIQITIYPWYIINYRQVRTPPLRSYLTAGMEVKKEKHAWQWWKIRCNLMLTWWRLICGLKLGINTNKYKRDTMKIIP